MKPLIAVTGKNGQLGWELEKLSKSYPQYDFVFCDRTQLNITNASQVEAFFTRYKPAVCVNCAAYTAVDKAEAEQDFAYKVNGEAVGDLARQCKEHGTLLITFSTDYVFNGEGTAPYTEDQPTDPVNYYGYSKVVGEQLALANWERSIVIRTSWVYSSHGNNFVKTMLRLMRERPEINVVNDQVGSPTYAADLAAVTMKIAEEAIAERKVFKGIYHYSNEGVITWYDFACEINKMAGLNCKVNPIPTSAFPTPAKRPRYSVLSKKRIVEDYKIGIKEWRSSLAECIKLINEKSGS